MVSSKEPRHAGCPTLSKPTYRLIHTVSPILAEPTRGGTLKFVTANDLKVLDPFWTTAYISRNHGYMIYDVLFA